MPSPEVRKEQKTGCLARFPVHRYCPPAWLFDNAFLSQFAAENKMTRLRHSQTLFLFILINFIMTHSMLCAIFTSRDSDEAGFSTSSATIYPAILTRTVFSALI
jgi:hypothetical protein